MIEGQTEQKQYPGSIDHLELSRMELPVSLEHISSFVELRR
jgi:hypothetical protein